MARTTALVFGLMALAIPVLITILIYAWDAYLAVFLILGFPASLVSLLVSWAGGRGMRESGVTTPWRIPALLTVLTIVAYGWALAKLASMPFPP